MERAQYELPLLNCPFRNGECTDRIAPSLLFVCDPMGWWGLTLAPIVLRGGLVKISGDYDVITIAQYLKIAQISSFLKTWYIF